MAHDVRPARDLRSFDATSHLLRRVTGDRARQTTVSRVQGEHLERAETRKVADCEISVLFDFSYGYGHKIQTCLIYPQSIRLGDTGRRDYNGLG